MSLHIRHTAVGFWGGALVVRGLVGRRIRCVVVAIAVMFGPALRLSAFAQPTPDASDSAASLPDAPQAADPGKPNQQTSSDDQRLPQTKRILGIIPNFRAVSTDERLPPQSIKEKFMTATDDSFDYSSIFVPAMLAGYGMAVRSYPEFGNGAEAYGKYFWHSAADQTIENYMVEFVVPVVARQDTRYYTLGRGGFWKRSGYALSRVVITRSDAGNEVFNVSEVVGAGAAAGISSSYYPPSGRGFGNVASAWGIDVGVDAASFLAKEFWPDIYRHLFHGDSTPVSASR
jgi:hypothetical protein